MILIFYNITDEICICHKVFLLDNARLNSSILINNIYAINRDYNSLSYDYS
jgi:hypothetical protein